MSHVTCTTYNMYMYMCMDMCMCMRMYRTNELQACTKQEVPPVVQY